MISRSIGALGLAGLIACALAGCGGDTTTVVVTSPPKTVTVAGARTGTQPPVRAPTSVPFRQPRPDEGVFDVDGTVTDVQVHRGGTPGAGAGYTSFVIRADAGPPLRAGAPGDLRLNTGIKQSLLDPACAGRVQARFTVAPARYTGSFDYALVRVRVLRDACRP